MGEPFRPKWANSFEILRLGYDATRQHGLLIACCRSLSTCENSYAFTCFFTCELMGLAAFLLGLIMNVMIDISISSFHTISSTTESIGITQKLVINCPITWTSAIILDHFSIDKDNSVLRPTGYLQDKARLVFRIFCDSRCS